MLKQERYNMLIKREAHLTTCKLHLTMKPIVMIPGFGGSVLVNKNAKFKTVFNQRIIDNRWINIAPFSKKSMDQWKQDMYVELRRDRSNNDILGFKSYDANIVPFDTIGTRGITNIVPEFDIFSKSYQEMLQRNFHYKYFGNMCDYLKENGYVEKQSLYGVPYDFRLILDSTIRNEFFDRLKYVLERATRKNKAPCVVVSHSLGGVLFKWFLTSYVDDQWISAHLHRWFCISAPFGGTPLALRIIFSGEYYVPMFNHQFKEPLRKNGGIIMCLPNSLAFQDDEVLINIENPHKNVSPGDFDKLASNNNVSFMIWRDLYKPFLSDIAKPLHVPVEIIYNTDVDTPQTFRIKNNGESPYSTVYGNGDGQVSVQSLEVAKRLFIGHDQSVDVFDKRNHINIMEDERLIHRVYKAAQ